MQTLEKRLYTAHGEASSGRTGTAKNSTGVINVKLAIPKEMGGPGGAETTTPEDLFAAGYAACFGSAAEHVARLKKIPHKGIKVASEVTIGTAGPGFALAVKLIATVAACACVTPADTAITSVATPASRKRTASSTAISSNGFIDIFTFAMSTPVPSDFTRTFTL